MNQTNQTQQSTQVSQEELAKTQVLNLTDVQEIAKFERKTSKRPAALFAFAGVLAIALGFSYPNIMTAIDAIPSNSKEDSVEIIYADNVLNNIKPNDATCTFTSPNNGDGTSGKVSYKFIFNEDNQLQRYTMTLNLDALAGDVNGLAAVQNYYNQYRVLDVLTLNGYASSTTYTETGMQTIVTADLSVLDKATLTPTHNALGFAQVTDSLGDTKDMIIQKYTLNNYICE
jgi:hypothetical protein